jgi:hypothetical protein
MGPETTELAAWLAAVAAGHKNAIVKCPYTRCSLPLFVNCHMPSLAAQSSVSAAALLAVCAVGWQLWQLDMTSQSSVDPMLCAAFLSV